MPVDLLCHLQAEAEELRGSLEQAQSQIQHLLTELQRTTQVLPQLQAQAQASQQRRARLDALSAGLRTALARQLRLSALCRQQGAIAAVCVRALTRVATSTEPQQPQGAQGARDEGLEQVQGRAGAGAGRVGSEEGERGRQQGGKADGDEAADEGSCTAAASGPNPQLDAFYSVHSHSELKLGPELEHEHEPRQGHGARSSGQPGAVAGVAPVGPQQPQPQSMQMAPEQVVPCQAPEPDTGAVCSVEGGASFDALAQQPPETSSSTAREAAATTPAARRSTHPAVDHAASPSSPGNSTKSAGSHTSTNGHPAAASHVANGTQHAKQADSSYAASFARSVSSHSLDDDFAPPPHISDLVSSHPIQFVSPKKKKPKKGARKLGAGQQSPGAVALKADTGPPASNAAAGH